MSERIVVAAERIITPNIDRVAVAETLCDIPAMNAAGLCSRNIGCPDYRRTYLSCEVDRDGNQIVPSR